MVQTVSLILIIALVAAACWGWHKGFLSQLGAAGGLILGVVACRLLGPVAMEHIPVADVTESFPRHYLQICGIYAGIYIAAYLAVVIVTKLMKLIAKKLCLGPVDSLAGAVVGLLKWAVPLSLGLNLVGLLWPNVELFTVHNPVIDAITGFAPWLLGILSIPTI